MHQDKIKSIDSDSGKLLHRKRAIEHDFERARERFDQVNDKVSVLNQTYETLRVNLHTLKQTYKMKSLSVVLKKKSAMYHLDQKQRQHHQLIIDSEDIDIPAKPSKSDKLTAEQIAHRAIQEANGFTITIDKKREILE